MHEQLERNTKALKDEALKKSRGKQALDKERSLMQEKRDLEEAITQIDRKKKVFAQESMIAHEIA